MQTSIKVAPHRLEAEQAVLAGILINNDAISQVLSILAANDFYKDAHKYLFQGMIDLYDSNEPIDFITLSQRLTHKKLLKKAGGVEYLASLVDAVSTSAGIRYHAEIIKDLAVRRSLISESSAIAESCFQEWKMTDEILEFAAQAIYDITNQRNRKDFSPFRKVINKSYADIEEASNREGLIVGVPTGFIELDRLTSGFQRSDLIIIAARPSMGKTALALNIAYNVARDTGKGIAIFSIEMSERQLGMRLLSMDARIDASNLRSGVLRGDEWHRLVDSASRLSDLPLFVDDGSAVTVLEMKSKCRRLKQTHDTAMVIIDYLQLIQGKGKRETESRQAEIAEISRALKALAKDLDMPVVALSQLNRRAEDRPNKRPQLSDLRESGAIEQDADLILFIYREEQYQATGENENIAEINLAKHRNGPTGHFRLTFLKQYACFENYAEDGPRE